MANFSGFTKICDIGLTSRVRRRIPRKAVVPVDTEGLLSPAVLWTNEAAYACDRASATTLLGASRLLRQNASGRAISSAEYHKKGKTGALSLRRPKRGR